MNDTKMHLCEMTRNAVHILRSSLMILLALLFRQAAGQTPQSVGIIFLPFENQSSFNGKWDVHVDVPRFMSAYVKEKYRILTISPVLVINFLQEEKRSEKSLNDVRFWIDLYKRFNVRYLVGGVVEDFDVSRFMTGEPMLGGYEAYKGEVKITYTVYDLERTQSSPVSVVATKGEAAGEYADRSLAFTLFGKPTQRTMEFRDLDKITFGSDEFNHTVIGEACFQLSKHFSLQLESALPVLRVSRTGIAGLDSTLRSGDTLSISLRRKIVTGTVVFVEGDKAFLNLGIDDGIELYQRIKVYAKGEELRDPATRELLGYSGEELGEVEVTELRGPHLSLTKIISGKGEVKSNDKVLVQVVE